MVSDLRLNWNVLTIEREEHHFINIFSKCFCLVNCCAERYVDTWQLTLKITPLFANWPILNSLNAIAVLISSIARLLNETSSVVSSRKILKCGYIKENDEKYPPPDSS